MNLSKNFSNEKGVYPGDIAMKLVEFLKFVEGEGWSEEEVYLVAKITLALLEYKLEK